MMYWGEHMSAGGWIFSVLATIVFLALIAALVAWLLSPGSGVRGPSGRSDGSAREILDRRLASGELTVDEYERIRHTLGGDGQASTAPAKRHEQPPRAAGGASA